MDYTLLYEQADAFVDEEMPLITNLSNLAALLYEVMEDVSWAGFYLKKGEFLYLGPFQGKTACTKIPLGKGVCGTAAKEVSSVLVKNVHDFPGHIACDCASNSELVVPITDLEGEVVGVIDLDSTKLDRFHSTDQECIERIAKMLSERMKDWSFLI